jgi:hypothetical protein
MGCGRLQQAAANRDFAGVFTTAELPAPLRPIQEWSS